MALTASARTEGEGFELCPEGIHQAVCVELIELGTLFDEKFNKWSSKVMIGWELPFVTDSEGKPFLIYKTYTKSLHEKSGLFKDLTSWRGKAFTIRELESFDLTKILTSNCQVQVIHNEVGGKHYANITSIMGLPVGVTKLPSKRAPQKYAIEDDIPSWMPSWISDKIKKSKEKTSGKPPVETTDIEPF